MTGEAAKQFHVETARRLLSEFMARQPVKPGVTLEVDRRPARSETEVKPFGLIVYNFHRMREVVSFALKEFQRLSPVGSKGDEHPGLYRRSWIMLVNGSKDVGINQIPPRAKITIVNQLAYARKVHTGAKGFEIHAGIVEKVRQLVLKRYGRVVYAGVQFLELSPGYVLKKPPNRGRSLTYPALVIEAL